MKRILQQQQTGQPSQVVLDELNEQELNEQDLAAVVGGMILPVQTRRVVTPQGWSDNDYSRATAGGPASNGNSTAGRAVFG